MGLLCNKSIPNCTHRHCALLACSVIRWCSIACRSSCPCAASVIDPLCLPRLCVLSIGIEYIRFPVGSRLQGSVARLDISRKLGVRPVVFNGLVGFPPSVADAAPTGLHEASSEKGLITHGFGKNLSKPLLPAQIRRPPPCIPPPAPTR
ncbi:hypothetical protein TIFTF001_026636 [Ficus carica]|uniref:Uncharacterized protein n=1 Tax=Ficus carica TaxID=3494 RepID=A0AA88IYD9_FICCA|nr:hypothetical protein TIFTF001_026636 [Ficus carica]